MEVLGKLVEKLDTSSWGQVNEADEVMAQLGRVPAPNLMTLVPLLGPPLWKERIYSHTCTLTSIYAPPTYIIHECNKKSSAR